MSVFKTHPQLLVDLINAENNSAVPYSALIVGTPVVNEDSAVAGDTTVRITAKENGPYDGYVVASYNRLDLQELFATADIASLAVSANVQTTRQLVDAVREAYGIALFEEDVVDTPIEYLPDGTAQTVLTATEGSYIYRGEIGVAISPVTAELSSVLSVTVLNGLNYPLMDTSNLVTPTVEVATLTGSVVKDDGTLNHSSGNPTEGYTTTGNGEISLSLAARLYRAGSAFIEPIDGEYLIEVPDNGDWNLTYAISAGPVGDSTHSITDLYDVSFAVGSVDAPEEALVFTLVPIEGGYSFRSADELLNIVDNTVGESGEFCINIQRLQHYVSYFPSAERNTFGSVLGEFEVELVARRKNSIAPVVRAKVGVVAVPAVAAE